MNTVCKRLFRRFMRKIILIFVSLFTISYAQLDTLNWQAPSWQHKYMNEQIAKLLYKPQTLTIAATGDVMLGSWIVDKVEEKGVDYPFDSTRVLLEKADLAIANLEAPLSKTGEKFENKTYTFKVPPYFVQGVKSAGVDAVTLANNHIVDFGCEALTNTMTACDSAGILHFGAGDNKEQACAPVYYRTKGQTVALIGFSLTYPEEFWATSKRCGTCFATEERLLEAITTAQDSADYIIVSFHWGAERSTKPKPYQKNFAHKAIDFGADLVIGHHPHVLQGFEIYNKKLVAYSLGNYVFGSYSSYAKESAILNIMFQNGQTLYANIIPISVNNYKMQFQPKVLRGKQKDKVIEHVVEISKHLNDGKQIVDSHGVITF